MCAAVKDSRWTRLARNSWVEGLIIVLPVTILVQFTPQPAGAVIAWTVAGLFVARLAALVWLRTGFWLMGSGQALIAIIFLRQAVLRAHGITLAKDLLHVDIWIFGAIIVALLRILESKLHPAEWTAYKAASATAYQKQTLWTLILGAPVPDMRKTGS